MNNSTSFLDVAYRELFYFPEPDPRTDGWLMMDNPVYMVSVVLLYFYLTWKGPQWMETRKAFEFPNLLKLYNILLVFLSVYIAYEFFMTAYLDNYTVTGCQPVVFGNSPLALRMVRVTWWYFFSKIIELLDSAFFILRKKNNQLTYLHIYHHGTMPFFCWISARYVAGGGKFVAGGSNSLVHVVMYSYYALAAMGPHMQKYLWWKRYLTRFQITQFSLIILHSLWALTQRPCGFPILVNLFVVVYTGSFMALFINFYRIEYSKKRQALKTQ